LLDFFTQEDFTPCLFTLLLEALILEQGLSFNIQMTVEVKLCKFTLEANVIHIVTWLSRFLDSDWPIGQFCGKIFYD